VENGPGGKNGDDDEATETEGGENPDIGADVKDGGDARNVGWGISHGDGVPGVGRGCGRVKEYAPGCGVAAAGMDCAGGNWGTD
jgi:hypothetical protein